MSYRVIDFANQLLLAMGTFPAYANQGSELDAIRLALGADSTSRDTTMQTGPVVILRPGNVLNSPFTNTVLKLINRGKGGNLSTITMANVIGGINVLPPVNTVAPTISYVSGGGGAGTVGGQYASNSGTWNPTGTPTRQWLRNGANIAGATGVAYTIIAADSGTSISCRVTMTNSAGSNSVVSNSVAIT
jgi:hypothetical protein